MKINMNDDRFSIPVRVLGRLDLDDPGFMHLYFTLIAMRSVTFYVEYGGNRIYVLEHHDSFSFDAVGYDDSGDAVVAVGEAGYVINQFDSVMSFMAVDTMKAEYIDLVERLIESRP